MDAAVAAADGGGEGVNDLMESLEALNLVRRLQAFPYLFSNACSRFVLLNRHWTIRVTNANRELSSHCEDSVLLA